MNRKKIFYKLFLGDKGISLVETIIAIGLLSFVGYTGINQLASYNRSLNKVQTKTNSRAIVNSIVEQVSNNLALFQVDYATQSSTGTVEKMPMAWDFDGKIVPEEECEKCKGRFGVLVTPVEGYRGLYMLTVKVGHTTFKNDSVVKKLVIQ